MIKTIGNHNLFAFYGSLRKEMYNHRAISDSGNLQFMGEERIPGYKMYSNGAYPFVFKSDDEKDNITVELFDIRNYVVKDSIHHMEVGAGYVPTSIEISGKSFVIYLFDDKYYRPELEQQRVPGGDWVKYLQLNNGEL